MTEAPIVVNQPVNADLLSKDPNNIFHHLPYAKNGIGNERFMAQIRGEYTKPLGVLLEKKGLSAEGYSPRRLGESAEDFYSTSDAVWMSTAGEASQEEMQALYNDAVMRRGDAKERLLEAMKPWYLQMRELGYWHYIDLAGVAEPKDSTQKTHAR